ncbi:MAG: serine/threonine-protein kinase, partial [Planctomycetaceae bacterium]
MRKPLPGPSDSPQAQSTPPAESPVEATVGFRRQLLAACERLEWEWREHGTCPLEPISAGFPPGQQGLVRSTLEELAVELRAEAEPELDRPAGDAAARFQIRRTLATGGMGLVSEACDREFHRTVALKEILPSGADDPEYRQRFCNEAEITGRLEHPGIIPVYSRGTHADGRPYYAMRLIAGEQAGTLQQALRQFHAAPPTDPAERDLQWRGLLRRVIDVCNTMAYAHSQGVLHRDLKPANILLGPYGETLVVDWGLAREFRSQSSGSSHMANPAH